MTLIVFGILCGPVAILIAAAATKTTPITSIAPKYEAFASVAAQNWIQNQPIGVPTAASVTIPSNTAPENTSDTSTTLPAAPTLSYLGGLLHPAHLGLPAFETHRFLATVNNRAVEIDVTVMDLASGPYLASQPTMLPIGFSTSGSDTNFVLPGQQITLSTAATQQITLWAKAMASNDSATLYRLTGDTENRTYPGIGGYSVPNPPTIQSTIALTGNSYAVRISVGYQTSTGTVLPVDYDLLLSHVNQPVPDITAWGPPGTATQLEPFQNSRQPAKNSQNTNLQPTPTT